MNTPTPRRYSWHTARSIANASRQFVDASDYDALAAERDASREAFINACAREQTAYATISTLREQVALATASLEAVRSDVFNRDNAIASMRSTRDEMQDNLRKADEETERLRDVIRWALGERDEFPPRPQPWDQFTYKPWYWWRIELRKRAGLLPDVAALPPTPKTATDKAV